MALGWMLYFIHIIIMTIICYKYFLIKYNPFKKNKPLSKHKNKRISLIYATIVYDY